MKLKNTNELTLEEIQDQDEAPASGEITEVNQQVISNPELLNEDPYNQGWLVKVRLNNPEELDSLLDSKSYINIIS